MEHLQKWKKGYENLPAFESTVKEKKTASRWKYLALGAIPALCCVIITLCFCTGLLAVGIIEYYDRCPPVTIPLSHLYQVPLQPNMWTNRSTVETAWEAYLLQVSFLPDLVFADATNPLRILFNHNLETLYLRVMRQTLYDVPSGYLRSIGVTLKVTSYISAQGDGPKLAGKAVAEFRYSTPDMELAAGSPVKPTSAYSSGSQRKFEQDFALLPNATLALGMWSHQVVVNIPYMYNFTSLGAASLVFQNMTKFLNNMPSTTPLKVISDNYIWEQSYPSDEIGPSNYFIREKLQSILQLTYSASNNVTLVQQGNLTPVAVRFMFRILAGLDGYGRWNPVMLDQCATLFQALANGSWASKTIMPNLFS